MEYRVKGVNGHIEVYDNWGNFLFSADTYQEAESDLRDMGLAAGAPDIYCRPSGGAPRWRPAFLCAAGGQDPLFG